ncbi:MAG TPA: hypothetical protein VF553_14635 [Pyrinomonadaceae bacterium]|jgi:hypothetical protein
MKLARYWMKGKAEARSSSDQMITVTSWGWSTLSQEEAKRRANEAAQRAAKRIEAGEPLPRGYGYSDRPPREEIVEEIRSADGNLIAAVTRNSYGALILNTRDLMFIDIDIPDEPAGERFLRTIKSLFGRRADAPESRIQKKIAALASIHSEYTVRLYRTFAGFRCAIINRRISPGSSESRQLLDEFGADPLYVKLCQNQQSFRARLTPKYWRCGARRPPNRFPWATEAEERRYRAWEREYEEQGRQFATCLLIEQFGTQEGNGELKMLISLHDKLAKADSRLALA